MSAICFASLSTIAWNFLCVLADVSADRALRRDTARFLLRLRDTLLAQVINRLLLVSVRLRQRLLAVHHARARHLAKFFYHCRRNLCHKYFPSFPYNEMNSVLR